jgi:hypothetical protein
MVSQVYDPRVVAPAPVANALVTLRPGQRLGILAAYCLYFVVVCSVAALSPSHAIDQVLMALVAFLALRVAPLVVVSRRLGWFHPLVFLTILDLLYFVRRAGVYSLGLDHHRGLPGWGPAELNRLLAFELFLMSIGAVAHYVGLFVLPAPRAPSLRLGEPRHLRKKLIAVVAAACAIGVLYVQLQSGLSAHILSWSESRHVALAGEFYWINAINLGPAACLVWFALDRAALRHPIFWICAALSLALVFLSTGSRGGPLAYVFLACIVWMLREGRVLFVRTAVVIVLAVPLIAMLGTFRKATWYGRIDMTSLTDTSAAESFDLGGQEIIERTTTSDGTLPILARVPDHVPFTYGSTYLAALLVPVPRSLWPEKPKMVGGQVAEVFFRSLGGIPPSPVGEAFWNFHVPGVIVVFLLFGIWHRWLLGFFKNNGSEAGMLLYAIGLLAMPGPSTPALVGMLQFAAPAFLLLIFTGAIRIRAPRT